MYCTLGDFNLRNEDGRKNLRDPDGIILIWRPPCPAVFTQFITSYNALILNPTLSTLLYFYLILSETFATLVLQKEDQMMHKTQPSYKIFLVYGARARASVREVSVAGRRGQG